MSDETSQPHTVSELPNVLRACLSEVGEVNDPLTDAELETFLDTHTGGGCELGDDCTNTPKGQVIKFKTSVAQGASRHDTIPGIGVWAMSEAMGECYSAREGFDLLKDAFIAEFSYDDDPVRFVYIADEFTRIMAWAAAQADSQRAHREPEIDEARLWNCGRPILTHIYTASLAQQMDPRGVLAVTLARAICSIPPYVTLPGIISSRASLNLHVALVGPSSGGKSSSVGVAKDALAVIPEPDTTTLGSGEGIAKAYAYRDGKTHLIITVTNTLLFCDTEIESVEALAKRSGSPLMSQWRKTFTGERLGFGYADPKNRIPVMEHRYRLCQILGIQEELAGWLLTGTQKAGGTPQRMLWAPVVYPDMPKPEDAPVWPGQMTLLKWPLPNQKPNGNNGQNGNNATNSKLDFTVVNKNVDIAAETKVLQENELQVPAEIETMIRQARWRFHHGEVDDLAGHSTLTRLKVAAGFMWLDGRTDKITDEDWELAGIVMAISDATRTQTMRTLAHKTHRIDDARGKSEARRERSKAGVLADARRKDIDRVSTRVLARLATAEEKTMGGRDLRQGMRDVPRELFDEVMVVLDDEGRIVTAEVEYRGQTGWKYTLSETD